MNKVRLSKPENGKNLKWVLAQPEGVRAAIELVDRLASAQIQIVPGNTATGGNHPAQVSESNVIYPIPLGFPSRVEKVAGYTAVTTTATAPYTAVTGTADSAYTAHTFASTWSATEATFASTMSTSVAQIVTNYNDLVTKFNAVSTKLNVAVTNYNDLQAKHDAMSTQVAALTSKVNECLNALKLANINPR